MIHPDDVEMLTNKIGMEGFSYVFTDYSYWTEIEDEKFHELRVKFISAYEDFRKYLKDQGVHV